MPPVKEPQESPGTPEAEDGLIGDWDPYVASIVESTQDQTPAAPSDDEPEAGRRARSGAISVSRRAQLLVDDDAD